MKEKADRIKSLTKTFTALLEQEKRVCQEAVSSLMELADAMHEDTADRRLKSLTNQLKRLQQRFDLLMEISGRDFLAKIEEEAKDLKTSFADSRAVAVLRGLIKVQPLSLNLFCNSLLDHLIEAAGAERGFLVSYLPESTEANVIAARNYQTTNLALEEYSLSRTLLRELFHRGKPLMIENAAFDPKYSNEASIRRLGIKSVLAVPLKQEKRTVGALYLENNTLPSAFDEEDLGLLEEMALFAISYLHHTHLLPIIFEQDSRVFFDTSKASREIIGQNPKILELLDVIDRIADSPATVLIEGESGTGKELVARALHYQSSRSKCPFIAINCAAIPENLMESELFGHERGAFTGAIERYTGRIEQGAGGTLFLDEISELAYPLQAKLLRFLQLNEFQRLGGKETIVVDVRVVAATSKDLKAMMELGKFQEALYYRLNVIPLFVPPLRERKEDIPLFIDHFLKKFSAIYERDLRMESEVYELLKEYGFPGNVRELENLIHRLVALAREDLIRLGDLPRGVLQLASQRVSLKKDPLYRLLHTPPADLEDFRRRKEEIKDLLADQERQLAEQLVQEAGGNMAKAASRLGVHRITLHRMVRRSKKLDD
jgi:Nif-specific regulatory protein